MAITEFTEAEIPELGKEGFEQKHQEFVNKLTGTTVPEMNADFLKTENIIALNAETTANAAEALASKDATLLSEARVLVSKDAAEASANSASTSAAELSNYVSMTSLERALMTKAEFEALAIARRANRAGSGFYEWGKHSDNGTTTASINEGIWVSASVSNEIKLGRSTSPVGVSKAETPSVNINGTAQQIRDIGEFDSDSNNKILMPDAPTVTHADSSNSGMVLNGRNMVDTSSWVSNDSTLSAVSGGLQVVTSGDYGRAVQLINCNIGQEYTVEAGFNYIDCNGALSISLNSDGSGAPLKTVSSDKSGILKFKFIASQIPHYISVQNNTVIDAVTSNWNNIAMFPSHEISRTDLVFIKSTDKSLAEKDFVYLLGNSQYLGSETDASVAPVAGAFAGSATYSLFGGWQADGALVGKGHVWSTLSESDKIAVVSNPENNLYIDGTDVRQREYKAITEPLDSDNYTEVEAFAKFGYTPHATEKGLYEHADGSLAIAVALAHRRNQGIKTHVNGFNPNGSKLLASGSKDYTDTTSLKSIADCFTASKMTVASGAIGQTSGRADGLFYDQVSERDILDLRASSKKIQDYDRLLEREFNKAVNGETRGSEGEWEMSAIPVSPFARWHDGINSASYMTQSTRTKSNTTTHCDIIGNPANYYRGQTYIDSTTVTTAIGDVVWAKTATGGGTAGNFYKALTVQAAINLAAENYSTGANWEDLGADWDGAGSWRTGVSGTPNLVGEKGEDYTDGRTLSTIKLSKKSISNLAKLVLRSLDNGVTWGSVGININETLNRLSDSTTNSANWLFMVFYETHTNMVESAVNSEAITSSRNVTALTDKASAALGQSLINKVLVGAQKQSASRTLDDSHTALTLTESSPAFKIEKSITRENGKAYLQLLGKEIKWDDAAHVMGDDSEILDVDNVSTDTDDNADTVLIFNKRIELPYFIGDDE